MFLSAAERSKVQSKASQQLLPGESMTKGLFVASRYSRVNTQAGALSLVASRPEVPTKAGGASSLGHVHTAIVRAGRGLAFKVREKLRYQKCRIVLIKKSPDRLQFCQDTLDVAMLRAGPHGKILGQLGHKFLVRHVIVFGCP